MLTKVIVYAYTQRLYSSRQIAKAVRENVMFMWIAGRQKPDFRTINRFRSERMKTVLEKIFTAVLQVLADEKYISLEHYFLDGTKIEANANRYTFVWGKAVVKHKAKLQEKVQTLFATIEEAEKQENVEHSGRDLGELGEASTITSDKLEHAVKELEISLQEKPKDKPLKKAISKIRRDLLPRLQKYESSQKILGDRNMENEQLEAIVKYGTYHKEKSKRWQNDVSKIDNWDYNEEEDTWTCKAGRKLAFYRKSKDKTESGYEIEYHHYRSTSCEGCPLKPSCTKAAGNREVKVSLKYMRLKKQARDKLRSEGGYALAVRRMSLKVYLDR